MAVPLCVVGRLKSLEREGKEDRTSAATKKTVDKATDAVKNVITPKK